MSWLVDGNGIIALVIASHPHHARAKAWFEALTDAFHTCSVTEGTFLRLHMMLATDKPICLTSATSKRSSPSSLKGLCNLAKGCPRSVLPWNTRPRPPCLGMNRNAVPHRVIGWTHPHLLPTRCGTLTGFAFPCRAGLQFQGSSFAKTLRCVTEEGRWPSLKSRSRIADASYPFLLLCRP